MLAPAWLVASKARTGKGVEARDPGMIGYTLAELRRLLNSLIQARSPDPDGIWSWSRWRRKRQYQARQCHYRRRGCALALTGALRLADGSRYARRRACGPDRHVRPGVFW